MDFNFFYNLFLKNNSKYFYYFILSFFGFSNSFTSYLLVKNGLNFFFKMNQMSKKFLYIFFIDFNFFYCFFLKIYDFKLLKIDFLKSIKTYRGIRFRLRLPVNGQNTINNAKTAKKGIF